MAGAVGKLIEGSISNLLLMNCFWGSGHVHCSGQRKINGNLLGGVSGKAFIIIIILLLTNVNSCQ